MKFSIRKKLLFLIAVLSLALIIASVLISSRLYSDSLEQNMKGLCTETADSLRESLESDHIDFMIGYRDKIKAVYDQNRELLEEAAVREFESMDQKEEFYSGMTEGIFPPKHGIGLSYDMLVFNSEYSQVLDRIDMLSFAAGMDTASVFIYDREYGNMIYLIDRMPENSNLYNFPASISKPWDAQLKAVLEAGGSAVYMTSEACVAVQQVGDENIFLLFSEQNTDIHESMKLFSLYSFVITLAATLVIGLVVLLFANKLIVRNIKKLTAASERFTSEIHGGSPEKVSAAITSRDEIGELSEQFDLMQDSIVGYVRSLEEKTSKEEKMKAELTLAARIQSESLPKDGLCAGLAQISSFLKPAREVGGDFYDYFMLDEQRMFFCLADVSGKGIPAALFMMRAKELIKAEIMTGRALEDFACRLNNALCAGNEESIFITAFFGILDIKSGELSYLRAGHEQPFLRRDGAAVMISEESNLVLGLFENMAFTADKLLLQPGDALLMYTDGLNEGCNEEKEEFGYERIAKTFVTAEEGTEETLYDALCAFCGEEEQFDDVTMLVLRFGKEMRVEIADPCYDDITKVCDAVLAELQDIDQDRASEIGLMIDEVMNNQISYAFDGTAHPRITVRCIRGGGEVILCFEDNGKAFDPLREATPEKLAKSEGGFGILLVKTLSDAQSYERKDGLNRLSFGKKIG